jgi:branched-chain amino acid transport system substrate-binding protein
MRACRRQPARFATVTLFVALLMAACGAAPAGESGSSKPIKIKIGALFDLSGATAEVGKPYSIGEQLFIEWKNAKNGDAGPQFELIHNDYGYQIPKAEELYAQYVDQDHVAAIAGWGTGDTEALKGKISRDKVPFISASYSAALADPSQTPYNFLVGTTYSDQLIIAQKWALEDWKSKGSVGAPKFAYLISDSPFGKSPTEDGKKHATANGVAEPLIVASPRGATDLELQLSQIKDSGANYVFIQNVSAPAALALKNAKALWPASAIQFICLNWCADELVVNLGGDAAEGLVGIIPFAPPSTNAEGAREALAYAKSKKVDLAGSELHFVQGWWSMAILVEGIERAAKHGQPITGERIKAALESIKDFKTGDVTADITFTPDDHAGNKTSRIYQVKGGVWTEIRKAMSADP